MIEVELPKNEEWQEVKKNIEVEGDLSCPGCGARLVPIWYEDKLINPYSGKMEHTLWGYCPKYERMYTMAWMTDSEVLNESR